MVDRRIFGDFKQDFCTLLRTVRDYLLQNILQNLDAVLSVISCSENLHSQIITILR